VLASGCAAAEAATDQDPSSADTALTADRTQQPAATGASKPKAKLFKVARVIDGDTIELGNGDRVRLVQIDSPEVGENQCFADEATEMLSNILPTGTKVKLVVDPNLDEVDRYERLLRYVFQGKNNVNLILVRRGAASVWFYQGGRGRYAKKLLNSAKTAKAAERGLWGACPGTRLDPPHAVATQDRQTDVAPEPPAQESPSAAPAQNCHASYRGACLDPTASDYDCAGGEGNGPLYTGTVIVIGPDPFELDGDKDGIGCD